MGKISELLPIGSVVLLKNGKKRVMVCGVKQTEMESDKEYDYMSVLYPEGHMADVGTYLFNHEDIEQVFFRGYEDEERAAFIEGLSNYYGEK